MANPANGPMFGNHLIGNIGVNINNYTVSYNFILDIFILSNESIQFLEYYNILIINLYII